MINRVVATILALTALSAHSLVAQAWDAPSFFSPRPGEDLGVYVVKPDGGGDVGVAGIWRQSGNINLGVRAGLTDDMIHVGGEFYDELDLLGPASPVAVSWVLGFGASFDDNVTWLRLPLGVSVGVPLDAGGMRITPYVHPRAALDFVTRGSGDEEVSNTDFHVPVDIGADIEVGPSLVLRVGATLDDGRNAFGAGAAWRLSRRLIVR